MKKILFRKILLDCFNFFLITLISTSIIIWVFQAVNYLDIMIEDGRSFMVYTNYTLLNLPKIISKILPFALFFSFTYVITRYELNNELMIFWSLGINKIELVNFLFKISFIITVFQILLTSFIVPSSQGLSRSLIKQSDIDFLDSFVKPKRFNDTINGLTIYTEEKDKNGILKNIYLKKTMSEGKFQITYAKKGIFKNKNGTTVLVLYDGQTINGDKSKITNFTFSKSDFGLTDFTTNTITQFKIQETSTMKLFQCLIDFSRTNKQIVFLYENCSKKNLDNIFEEIFKRFLMPFYIPLLILCSLILILKSKEDVSYTRLRVYVFLIGLITIIFSFTTLNYVKDNLIDNFIIIFIPFIITFFIYSMFLYKFKLKFKSTNN